MQKNKLILFSLDQKNRQASNAEYLAACHRLLDFGLGVVELTSQALGAYTYDDGTKSEKRCIVVQYSELSQELINEIESIALRLYSQESYLIVNEHSQAFLMRGAANSNVNLGTFTRVKKVDAMKQKGWTRIDKSYYTII